VTFVSRCCHKLRLAVLTLSLFGIIVGAKLVVIDRFGSDLPTWDQWDAEADKVYLPFFQHRLDFFDLFLGECFEDVLA